MQTYAAPAHQPVQEARAVAPASETGTYGNVAEVEALGLTGTDPAADGAAGLPPELAAQVQVHLANHTEAVTALSGVAGNLPVAYQGRSGELVAVTSIIAGAIHEDLALLEQMPAEEAGALLDQLKADAGDLADGVLLLDAYRMLAEETHRLRILQATPALVALVGAPATLIPSLGELWEVLERVRVARVEVQAAWRELGEVGAQLAIQQGLGLLLDVSLGPGVGRAALMLGKVFFDNWIDSALGADAQTLPAEMVSGADNFVDNVDIVDKAGAALGEGKAFLLDDDLLGRVGTTIDLLDAGVEGLEATGRVLAALRALEALEPEMAAARTEVTNALAALDPILAYVRSGIASEAYSCADTIADAAILVNDTEAELGGLF